MKFFLLSLVINIILLLLPLKSNTLEQKSEKKIVVTLNLKEKKVAPPPKPLPPKPKPPKKAKKKTQVKKIAKKPKKVVKKIVKKTKPKKVAKKPKKKIKPQPKTADLKTTNTPTKPLHVKNTEKTPLNPSPKTTKHSSTQNTQTKQTQKKEFCKKGVDFIVTKKPRLSYPRRAKRLRINKIVHVDVYFKVQSGGGIVILGAKGGNKLFQDEAKKRTKSIKIKLLNKQAIHCKMIQPFRFEP